MTQKELALAVEAGPGSVKNWESGKPIRNHAPALERVLGITLSETVGPAQNDAANKVLMDLPEGTFAGFSEVDREEAVTAGRLGLLEKAAEVRRRLER